MKSIIPTIVLLFLSLNLLLAQSIYVSTNGDDANSGTQDAPLKSVQLAIDKALDQGVEIIWINAGEYPLSETIKIRPDNNIGGRLQILGDTSGKVTIRGGREITNWKKAKHGLWTCKIPDVKNGEWNFTQLFVNGDIRHRARKPNEGFLRVKGMPEGTPKTVHYHTDCQSFEYAEGDINPNWNNLEDAEVIVYHFWTDSHLPIQSIDTDKNVVTFKHKAGKVFTDDFSEDGARYIVENVFEELDAPGEWYLNRKTGVCYYYPYPEENIKTTRFFAPVISQLIKIEGDPINNKYVENIQFKNIEFSYTNWQLPIGNSNDRQGSASVPAAISLKGAKNCSFTNCSFTKLGTWAFELNEGCVGNVFQQNEIGHIAAGGFRVNGGEYEDHIFLRTRKNKIIKNHIHHYGEVFPSAVGILLQNTEANLVSHNEVEHGFYTGVSIGWKWGYQRSISRDNIIEFNHIHHIGQGLLSDMGAIYTLGISPGTIIRNNLIHDVDANHYGGWGIYHDEGSSHILDENNIVYNTKFAAFNIHFCKEVTVRNNIFALGRLQQLSRSRVEPHKSVFFEQNIIYWKEGKLLDGNWKDKEYAFHFHPKNEKGLRNIKETFDMDFNVFYNPDLSLNEVVFNEQSWDDWHKMGKDQHSVYADPLFVDVKNFNFNLKENSPAFKLGFQNIDMSNVGLGGSKVGPVILK